MLAELWIILNENIYRGLIRCLLHPLGVPDTKVGLRPGDLIDRLRQIFEIEREEHEYFIKEELTHRPRNLQINVNVVEGKNLKTNHVNTDKCDLYCLVSIVHPLLRPGKSSPKNSPKNSPKSSPKLQKHLNGSWNSISEPDVLKTQSVKNSQDPKWNEEFQLYIDDFFTDEVHIYVCDKDMEEENTKHVTDRHHGIKHLFHILRHIGDDKELDHGCIGRIIIPARNIPAGGADWCCDVLSVGNKNKTVGQCRIRLDICYRQDDFNSDEYFSVEDYYQAAQQVFGYSAKLAMESFRSLDVNLPEEDRRILDIFATSHHISSLSQSIVHVICLLEWTTTHDNLDITQMTLKKAVQELQMTWVTKQFDQSNLSQKMPITDAEIALYRKASSQYITCICNHLGDLPLLFPPSIENLNVLRSKLGVTVQLLELDLWESKSSPEKDVTDKVVAKLQEDLELWISERISSIVHHGVVKDTVIPELNTLEEIIHQTSSHCSPLGAVKTFYNLLGIQYYRVVSFALESKISEKLQELMIEMDKYQHRYHNYIVNITASSRLSLRVYFAVRKLYSVIRDNINRRDVFRLSISQYQHWFQESLVFWVQTFKNECMNRIEKALEIDKDVVVATSRVKFSNSSVDVLSCFAKITEEWRHIDFHEQDSNLMGVTKITDLICDGARMYADKIHSILERNGYYDNTLEQFDITERLCITLNNIEHVRKYLTELPQLLDWESIIMLISTKYENEEIGDQALSTLKRLVKSADSEIILKSQLLLQEIAEKMKIDIARFMEVFTQKRPERASSVDLLIGYLSTNLKVLHERLMASIYPRMTEQMWTNVLRLLDEQLLIGERPEYYYQMKQHLRALTSYFVRGGVEDDKIKTFYYSSVKSRLDLNSMTTEELMLEYFHSLADNIDTPTEYYGHVAIKTAYMEETRGNVTLFIKVIRASDLPGLDTSGLSDPYIVVNLQPQTMFGHHKAQKTKVVDKTLNPVFNTVFQFPNVPKEYLLVKGAVILLSVLDYDHVGSDDFAGEIVMHLSSVSKINMSETVDSRPVVMMPVKRPSLPQQGPYQVLTDRCSWDKSAKMFLTDRKRFIHKQPVRTDTQSKFFNFFSLFTGGKT